MNMNKHSKWCMKLSAWSMVLSIAVLFGVTGCTEAPTPSYKEINRISTLDGELKNAPTAPSPVLIDVYDRSIPQEVYSSN
jgi:hypothetical protein